MVRYCLPAASLVFRHFDGDDLSLVFDTRSGDTHLLDGVSAEICQVLRAAPAALDEIERSLLLEFSDDDPSLIHQAVEAAVQRLEHSGLIGKLAT